jgi:hypothetical protein
MNLESSADVLLLEELMDSIKATFAAKSTLFVSAKWGGWIRNHSAVDGHHSRFHRFSDFERTAQIG